MKNKKTGAAGIKHLRQFQL